MGQNLLEKYIDENKKLPLTLKMDELFWKLVARFHSQNSKELFLGHFALFDEEAHHGSVVTRFLDGFIDVLILHQTMAGEDFPQSAIETNDGLGHVQLCLWKILLSSSVSVEREIASS